MGVEEHGEEEAAAVSPDILRRCVEQLRGDFQFVQSRLGSMSFQEKTDYLAYCQDISSLTWENILKGLSEDDLAKAAQMQGMGEFIGVDHEGHVLIISRGDGQGSRRPEQFGFLYSQMGVSLEWGPKRGEKPMRITTDTPDHDKLVREIGEHASFAHPSIIREAVQRLGLEIPCLTQIARYTCTKEGIVAAIEAVTGYPFVGGESNPRVHALMGNNLPHTISQGGGVWIVDYYPYNARITYPANRKTYTTVDHANYAGSERGVVCVLKGSNKLSLKTPASPPARSSM